jgi:hypothetical protein
MDVQRPFLTCPDCKARVPVIYSTKFEYPQAGDAQGLIHYRRIIVGECPWCKLTVVGNAEDVTFSNRSERTVSNAQLISRP